MRDLTVFAAPAHVQHVKCDVGERLERGQVDRASPERAAEHQHAGVVEAHREPLTRRATFRSAGGDRPAGDAVARSAATGEREGKAYAPRERGQHPVGQAQVAVGLGDDEGDAQRERGHTDRPGDVAAAAHHGVRGEPSKQGTCARDGRGASASARRARSGFERLRPSTAIG